MYTQSCAALRGWDPPPSMTDPMYSLIRGSNSAGFFSVDPDLD